MFFLIPIGVDYRAARQPVVTFSILGACLLFFLLNLGAGLSGGSSGFEGFCFSSALIPSTGRPHTWITSLFMHAGLFHLLGNLPDVLTMRENGTLGPDAFFWDEEANTWRPIPELQ